MRETKRHAKAEKTHESATGPGNSSKQAPSAITGLQAPKRRPRAQDVFFSPALRGIPIEVKYKGTASAGELAKWRAQHGTNTESAGSKDTEAEPLAPIKPRMLESQFNQLEFIKWLDSAAKSETPLAKILTDSATKLPLRAYQALLTLKHCTKTATDMYYFVAGCTAHGGSLVANLVKLANLATANNGFNVSPKFFAEARVYGKHVTIEQALKLK